MGFHSLLTILKDEIFMIR
jgi:hypothetical protein